MKKAISSLLCLAMLLTVILPATAFASGTDFTPNPKTPYAETFINKCEGQQWFINEVERLLNAEQKTLDTIENASDLDVIKAIGLRDREITGKIPAAIGELGELRYLFLAGNHLSGEIPAGLYALPKLENVDLSENDYTGSIPAGFGTMSSLKVLMLANNGYTGTIPGSILSNTKIEVLDLHSNQLSGGVPTALSGMTALTYLDLAGNNWGGKIPDLSALTNLIALDLGGCNLTGTIPESIYSLTKLQILNLGSNSLTGEISDSLVNLTAMQCLILDNNQLRGTIPADFTLDTSSKADSIAHLENNVLRGNVPAKLADAVTAGAKVYLDNNYMGGTAVTDTESFAGDFADNATGQYQLSAKQNPVQISQTSPTNLYALLENKALFSTEEEKPLLMPAEYSVSCDNTKVEATITNSGILVKALAEIPKAEAVPVTISILGNEGVARSTVAINVTTDSIINNGGGGGGGGPTYYTVTSDDNTVTFDKEKAKSGDTVTITVQPDENGNYTTPIVQQTTNGKQIQVKDLGNGVYTFTMPAGNVTINLSTTDSGAGSCKKDASCPIAPFTDANPKDWYHDGVHYCIENGLMNGFPGSIFKPNDPISRAQIVTILYRLDGSPAVSGNAGYSDLTQDWYKDAVLWATQNSVVNGYGNGKFGPDDPITREQFATILYRYSEFKEYDTSDRNDLKSYMDAGKVSDWALTGVQWANATGLMTGRTSTTLVPDGTATRAEAATLIYRFCENITK